MSEMKTIEIIRAALRREMRRAQIKAKPLSKAAGLSESAVRDLMTKVDDPKIGTLLKLAAHLQIPPGLLFGFSVPVVGTVETDGIIYFLDPAEISESVPQPPTALTQLIALKVVGDSLLPIHRHGDILYLSRTHDRVDPHCIGEECAVQVEGGLAYLKPLAMGSEAGCYTLRALFGGKDIENVRLAWAAPVLFVSRAINGKNHQ
jgi:transcriptional regulator with XRE-family HTH domain